MKLTKVFRDNSRILLLIFMSLLLVVFLVGDVVGRRQASDMDRDFTIGEAFGEPVRRSRVASAAVDWDIARRIFPQLQFRLGTPESEDICAYLLMREADLAGIHIGADRIQAMLATSPEAAAFIEAQRSQTGRSLDAVCAGLGRALAVSELFSIQYEAAVQASAPRLRHSYRDRSEEADVRVSVIDGRAFLDRVETPTEEQIVAHFEQGKERTTQHTADGFAFGYRNPDRVVVEFLTVDPRALLDTVMVKERDVRRFYDENAQRYTRRIEPAPTEPGQAPAPPQSVQLSYEEVRERVREDYRLTRAIEESHALLNRVREEARRPWDSMPLAADGSRPAPATQAVGSFEELQQRFSASAPVKLGRTQLGDAASLAREAEIGMASAQIERRGFQFAQLALHIEGGASTIPAAMVPKLRLNEPGPVVFRRSATPRGAAPYQAFVFRVVEFVPSGPPALEDVREKIVEDLRKMRAHELAGTHAEAIGARARELGLDDAVAEAVDLQAILVAADAAASQPTSAPVAAPNYARLLAPASPPGFRRSGGFVMNVGSTAALAPKLFALAEPTATAAAHKVVVQSQPADNKWILAELIGLKPMYEGQFDAARDELEAQVAMRSSGMTFFSKWFDPANIMARTRFTPAQDVLAAN